MSEKDDMRTYEPLPKMKPHDDKLFHERKKKRTSQKLTWELHTLLLASGLPVVANTPFAPLSHFFNFRNQRLNDRENRYCHIPSTHSKTVCDVASRKQ
jgi:hypothetical protein